MTSTDLNAKSKALNDLRSAVEALRPHLTTPDQQATLFLIDEATARLQDPVLAGPAGPIGLSDFDASRLSHLMTLTGPDLAVELLARLTEDLTSTEAQLDLGVATADWKRLREGSHVLISLSGSVGALSLQAMAETLNAIAHRQDRDALDALMPPLSGELASLIRLIRATQPPAKGM
jgi:HPt (histidine-containing phosphotransfer) domain-containing protein